MTWCCHSRPYGPPGGHTGNHMLRQRRSKESGAAVRWFMSLDVLSCSGANSKCCCSTIIPIHFSFAAVIMICRDETAGITCRRRSPQSVYGGHRTPFSVHPFQLSQLPCRRLVGDVTDGKRNCHCERRKKQKNQFSGKIRQAVRTFDSLLLSL